MIKRTKVNIDCSPQMVLFESQPLPEPAATHTLPCHLPIRIFDCPDPEDIFIGQDRLRSYLEKAKIKAPLIIRELLGAQDWQPMEAVYANTGRPPYAPSAMMGLILYGVQKGITSLRQLEQFARADLGCIWVTGGIAPDHSVIGKFICRHEDAITDQFFKEVTANVLKQTQGQGQSLAGDGTVIEAACSHYRMLKEEAVQQALEAARKEARKDSRNEQHQARLQQAVRCAEIMQERGDKKRAKGEKTDQLCISPQEPDAMLQKQKRGRGSAPSYKPSVLVNEQRIILAQAIHASSETEVIPGMLDQSEEVSGDQVEELLLDAGYCSHGILHQALERDINLLCPEGKVPGKGKESDKRYTKGQFYYDEQGDGYRCPAGQWLKLEWTYQGKANSPGYRRYGGAACATCAQRAQCTKAKAGRKIKRYEQDEWKEALRMVMGQAQAQKRFSQRQVWVEPVFSVLRGQQNLNRFRRKGIGKVRVEFGLHVLAYNIGRLIAFFCAYFVAVIGHIWGHSVLQRSNVGFSMIIV